MKMILTLLRSNIKEYMQVQYSKYLEQMSKLSSKIEKIERVKQHLKDIQKQENSKITQRKYSLNKKYEYIQKNKQKHLDQKVKSYKINQQMWQAKMKNINRKNKDQVKKNFQQVKKYQNQVQTFWRTKTENIHAHNKNQQMKSSYLKRQKHFDQSETTNKNYEKYLPQFTNNKKINEQDINHYNKNITKSVRFHTQNSQDFHRKNDHFKTINESSFSNKLSILSLREKTDEQNSRDSKKSLLMTNIDQQRHHNQSYRLKQKTEKANPSLKLDNLNLKVRNTYDDQFHQHSRLSIRKDFDFKVHISFQKTMKKLDKIYRLKQKNLKNLKASQVKILSPSKARKSIDSEKYRLLRAKSESKKKVNNVRTQQNDEMNDNNNGWNKTVTNLQQKGFDNKGVEKKSIQQNNKLNNQLRPKTLNKQNMSRITIQSRNKREEESERKKNQIMLSYQQKWKKDKIVKAIKDKIARVKIEQIKKIKSMTSCV